MKIINATCADDALFQGINLLMTYGVPQGSRDGDVVVVPFPVMTVNENPLRRVLFSPQRDANPFFHLNEALWMLAGRNDIEWLDQFVKGFSTKYGERTGIDDHMYQHGAYGFRWRQHFDVEGGGDKERVPDQLETVIRMLKKNPNERRAVIAMWDPVADLERPELKDVPCNTQIYLRVREVSRQKQGVYLDQGDMSDIVKHALDLTVCCRSNDAVMGAHGANVVHFSILQEYLAARIGVAVGKLYQLSNNYHMYNRDIAKLVPYHEVGDRYLLQKACHVPMVALPDKFDEDLVLYFSKDWYEKGTHYFNPFFCEVAIPLRRSYELWRMGKKAGARCYFEGRPESDWIIAAEEWFDRRLPTKGTSNGG